MIEEEKTCVTCGETFTIHAVQQRTKKYCSYACSSTYKKTGNKKGRPRKKK